MEYRQSSYIPWADSQEVVLADEAEHYDTGIQVLKAVAKDPDQFAKFKVSFDRVLPNAVKRAFGRPGADQRARDHRVPAAESLCAVRRGVRARASAVPRPGRRGAAGCLEP